MQATESANCSSKARIQIISCSKTVEFSVPYIYCDVFVKVKYMLLQLLGGSGCSECRVDARERLTHTHFFTILAGKGEIPMVRNLDSQH